MGLDTTHDCWHGPYSWFNKWRIAVAQAYGIDDLEKFWEENKTNQEQTYGLWITPPAPIYLLLQHADNEGLILANHCGDLADALERLLPKLKGNGDSNEDDWTYETERFIAGLRDAAEQGQNVEFH